MKKESQEWMGTERRWSECKTKCTTKWTKVHCGNSVMERGWRKTEAQNTWRKNEWLRRKGRLRRSRLVKSNERVEKFKAGVPQLPGCGLLPGLEPFITGPQKWWEAHTSPLVRACAWVMGMHARHSYKWSCTCTHTLAHHSHRTILPPHPHCKIRKVEKPWLKEHIKQFSDRGQARIVSYVELCRMVLCKLDSSIFHFLISYLSFAYQQKIIQYL